MQEERKSKAAQFNFRSSGEENSSKFIPTQKMHNRESCDPLEVLHSDVFDLIFQHLPQESLLESSTVSPLWYEVIGASINCMDRLTIAIQNFSRDSEYDSLDKCHAVLIGKRRYRNIYAEFSHQNRDEILQILEMDERKWKNVQLLNGTFSDGEFFELFHQTVEFLNLTRMACEQKTDGKQVWQFPRLRHLKVFSCNKILVDNLQNCSSLKHLVISENADSSSGESFQRLLSNNTKLSSLTILSPAFQSFFPPSINTHIHFKLKKLVIDTLQKRSTEEDRKCLLNLCENQFGSLETVDINVWCGSDILALCFRMPQLRDVSINVKGREKSVDWKRVNLAMNEKISRLHIRNICEKESKSFYDTIFSNLPNLKVYKSKFSKLDDLLLLSQRCKNLEELYIENFDVPRLPNEISFPKLQIFKTWEVNEELTTSIASEGAKNRFEELILLQ